MFSFRVNPCYPLVYALFCITTPSTRDVQVTSQQEDRVECDRSGDRGKHCCATQRGQDGIRTTIMCSSESEHLHKDQIKLLHAPQTRHFDKKVRISYRSKLFWFIEFFAQWVFFLPCWLLMVFKLLREDNMLAGNWWNYHRAGNSFVNPFPMQQWR